MDGLYDHGSEHSRPHLVPGEGENSFCVSIRCIPITVQRPIASFDTSMISYEMVMGRHMIPTVLRPSPPPVMKYARTVGWPQRGLD